MKFSEYQVETGKTAFYPQGMLGFVYCALAIGGETGEIQEKVKKILRDKNSVISEEDRDLLKKEIGDVLWYLSQFATELGLSLDDVAVANIEKLRSRQQRGVLTGSGDSR